MTPIKPLNSTDIVNARVVKMTTVPVGQSAYSVDTVRSGVELAHGWDAMFESGGGELHEVVLYNRSTGQRLLVEFTPAAPQFEEYVVIPVDAQPQFAKGLVFSPDFNPIGQGKWEWLVMDGRAAHAPARKTYILVDRYLLVRADVLVEAPEKAAAWTREFNDGTVLETADHLEHVHSVLNRYRRLAGIEQPVIHRDGGGSVVKVTEIKTQQ